MICQLSQAAGPGRAGSPAQSLVGVGKVCLGIKRGPHCACHLPLPSQASSLPKSYLQPPGTHTDQEKGRLAWEPEEPGPEPSCVTPESWEGGQGATPWGLLGQMGTERSSSGCTTAWQVTLGSNWPAGRCQALACGGSISH